MGYKTDLRIARLRADQCTESADIGLVLLLVMQAGRWIGAAHDNLINEIRDEEARKAAHLEIDAVEQQLIERFAKHARLSLRTPSERRRRPKKWPEPLLTDEERAAIAEESKRFGLAQATGAERPHAD